MRTHPFGPAARDVPAIGQGTWYMEQAPRQAAVVALRRGLDLGLTHIDTAELYGGGAAEEIVGEAMNGRRDEVFLVSKVMPNHASRAGTIAACEKSLKLLGTDRLDCYLLHWRGRHPLSETIAGLEDLVSAGKILTWGVSNYDADEHDEALANAGPGRIACNQVLYHLEERGIEHRVIPWCEKNKVAIVGYSPFGHDGFPGPRTTGGKVLAEIAGRHDATPRKVALAFLVRSPSLFTIPKAAKVAHVEENAGAGDVALTADDVAAIESAFPIGRPRSLAMI
jgi:diketogulonate reductase-like aldo/keto reductase